MGSLVGIAVVRIAVHFCCELASLLDSLIFLVLSHRYVFDDCWSSFLEIFSMH